MYKYSPYILVTNTILSHYNVSYCSDIHIYNISYRFYSSIAGASTIMYSHVIEHLSVILLVHDKNNTNLIK